MLNFILFSDLPTNLTIDYISQFYDNNIKKLTQPPNRTVPSIALQLYNYSDLLFHRIYGDSDIENNATATNDTLYEWGSVTKILTHVGIMQLYENNSIDLNADIEEYLGKGFLHRRKYDDKITILNLMNHNAGFDEYVIELMYEDFSGDFDSPQNPYDPNNPHFLNYTTNFLYDYLYRVQPKQFAAPNKHVAYSNYGVALEGLIIEKVSGMSYIDYVHEHIFKVLDMKHTSIDPLRKDISLAPYTYSVGYTRSYDAEKNEYVLDRIEHNYSINCYPAGAALGTISDLGKLIVALNPLPNQKSPLFNKRETLDLFLNESWRLTNYSTAIHHGLFEEFYGNGLIRLGHNGNTLAQSAYVTFDPEIGLIVIALTNSAYDTLYGELLRYFSFGVNDAIDSCLHTQQCHNNAKELAGNYRTYRTIHNGFLRSSTLQSYEIITAQNEAGPVGLIVYKNVLLYQFSSLLYTLYMHNDIATATFSFINNSRVEGYYTTGSESEHLTQSQLDEIDSFQKYSDQIKNTNTCSIVLAIISGILSIIFIVLIVVYKVSASSIIVIFIGILAFIINVIGGLTKKNIEKTENLVQVDTYYYDYENAVKNIHDSKSAGDALTIILIIIFVILIIICVKNILNQNSSDDKRDVIKEDLNNDDDFEYSYEQKSPHNISLIYIILTSIITISTVVCHLIQSNALSQLELTSV